MAIHSEDSPINHPSTSQYDPPSLVERVKDNLEHVVQEKFPFNLDLINNLTLKLSLDKSYYHDKDDKFSIGVVAYLLPAINGVLRYFNLSTTPEASATLELLSQLMEPLSFENILSLINIDLIIEALKTPTPALPVAFLKLLEKAHPSDMLANTPIIKAIVELIADKYTNIPVVNAAEKAISVISSGELVRRRLLSDSVLKILMKMKDSNDTTLLFRLLDLIEPLIIAAPNEIPESLYHIDPEIIVKNHDVILTLRLIQFYTSLTKLSILKMAELKGDEACAFNYPLLLTTITPQLEAIFKLYSTKNINRDISSFLANDIALLFKTLSRSPYTETSIFEKFDEKYHVVKDLDSRTDLSLLILTVTNPKYLAAHNRSLIIDIPLKTKYVKVYQNLMSSPESFKLIYPSITTSPLKSLPKLEMYQTLESIASYKWSVIKLLHDLPQIMNLIIDEEATRVVDVNVLRSRCRVLEKLSQNCDKSTLGIWYKGIYEELSKAKKDVYEPKVLVHDKAF